LDKNTENKQVYYNLEIIWRNISQFYTGVFGILVIVIFTSLGYFVASKYNTHLQEQNIYFESLIEQHQDELIAIQQQLNFVLVELEVEKLASQNLQTDLQQLKLQNAELKKERTFYQNVMAPELNAEGVLLDDLILEPTLSANRFRYKVVLVHTRKQKRYASGHVLLDVTGKLNDKITQTNIIKKADGGFSFKYFQVLEGELILADGFRPERVEISIVLPKKRWQKYSRVDKSFTWKMGSLIEEHSHMDEHDYIGDNSSELN
jgi:hypothetical protein